MKVLEKIIAWMFCFMHTGILRLNSIFNNDAGFSDFSAQKFPFDFFN